LQKQLELAAFNAWPALEQLEEEGIVYRFANGYTKRANSANILSLNDWQLPQLVAKIERYYTSRGQTSIIRIPSFVKAAALDQYLGRSGYQYASKSLVMTKALTENARTTILKKLSAKDWLNSFVQLSQSELEHHTAHLAILEQIKDGTLFAVLEIKGEAVACGIGVIGQNCVGLFDVVCAKSCRRKGYAAQLISGIHDWAYERGVLSSYLQVLASNSAGVGLYQKLGFVEDYYYWYRVKN
jgi:GNAT superfamily N-acetyltransferase